MDASGTPIDEQTYSSTFNPYGPPPPPPPPDILTLADLLAEHDIVVAKERADKELLESIGTQTVQAIKPKLIEWVVKGRPDGFPIIEISVVPPTKCSDGQTRNLPDYVEFCSGKPIQEHVGLLQAKLPDIHVSFANIGGKICVTVLKA